MHVFGVGFDNPGWVYWGQVKTRDTLLAYFVIHILLFPPVNYKVKFNKYNYVTAA